MSSDSPSDKNIEKSANSDSSERNLDTPDAQEAREADKNTITEIGNQNPDNWKSAEGHFAIVDENQVLASRDVTDEKRSQSESAHENQNLSVELQAIRESGNPEQSQLAEQIQNMRSATKEKGLPTSELDKFAKETFSAKGQEVQFECGAFKSLSAEQAEGSNSLPESDQPIGGYEQENRADGGITIKVGLTDEVHSDKSLEAKESILESESPDSNRLVAVENATTHLKNEIGRLYGSSDLASLNIEKSDVGYALGAYLLSPDISKAFGPDATRRFGQQLMVFGLAPSFGLADEIKQKFTKETGQTVHDGSSNFLWGSAFGAVLESHPYVAATIGTIFMGALINEQLFSPEAKERNQEVFELAQQAGNASPEDLIKQCDKSAKLLGPEAYKAAFDFATGGIGIPHGYTAAKGVKSKGLLKSVTDTTKSVIEKLKQLPEQAKGLINIITGQDQKLIPLMASASDGSIHPTARDTESINTLFTKRKVSESSDGNILGKPEVSQGWVDDFSQKLKILDLENQEVLKQKFSKLTELPDFQERNKLVEFFLREREFRPDGPVDLEAVLHPMDLNHLKTYKAAVENFSRIDTDLPNFSSGEKATLKRDTRRDLEAFSLAVKSEGKPEKSVSNLERFNKSMDFIADNHEIIFKPGVHDLSMKELERQFATTPHRRGLFEGLTKLAKVLKEAGCEELYVDGSYITRKGEPGDFDCCWERSGMTKAPSDPLLLDTTAEGVKARKKKYGGDIFLRHSDEYGDRVLNWQRDERTGKEKGIIKINLREWK